MDKLFFSTGLRWLWITATVAFIDLGSKYLLLQNFYLEEEKSLFPFLNICYVQNYGMAFGFLSNCGVWKYWFFSVITIGVCVILLLFMRYANATKKTVNISYGLILGGALGNLFDRWWHGFVVDMIDFFVGSWHFVVFNFADAAICSGVLLITVERFFLNPPNLKEDR